MSTIRVTFADGTHADLPEGTLASEDIGVGAHGFGQRRVADMRGIAVHITRNGQLVNARVESSDELIPRLEAERDAAEERAGKLRRALFLVTDAASPRDMFDVAMDALNADNARPQ